MPSTSTPGFYRTQVGRFTAIALHDGVFERDRPDGFVRNASSAEVGEAFAEAGMSRDKLTLTFNPLAVDTGDGIVLIDTGMGDAGPPGTGHLLANLKAAGIAPADVKSIIISHFHGDHINGLRAKDGAPVFPAATVYVPRIEWEFWMDDAKIAANPGLKDNAGAVRKAFADGIRTEKFDWNDEVIPGFIALDAAGHTPGMSAIRIASGSDALLYVADITNTPLLFARHPEWQAMFDMDPELATRTRRRMLDEAAAEHQRLFFFHAPFPALGTVVKSGDGYEYLPALWRS